MLTSKVQAKLDRVVENYALGNKVDAAKVVQALTRVQLVQLLRNAHTLNGGHFIGNTGALYDFEAWVERVLSGWSE